MNKKDKGGCFGKWSAIAEECKRCAAVTTCAEHTAEKASKMRSGHGHLIQTLKDRFSHSIQKKDNAIAHYFRDKETEDLVISVTIASKTNKVRIASKKGKKVFDGIKDIEFADKVIKHFCGEYF